MRGRLERRGLMMQRTIRSVALALALPVLTAGAVHARPLTVHPAPAGFLDALWQWVASSLPHWSKAGGEMDPDGYTAKDGGVEIDPNGAHHNLFTPLPTSNAGSEMDPNG
jgi:hypothetical protein